MKNYILRAIALSAILLLWFLFTKEFTVPNVIFSLALGTAWFAVQFPFSRSKKNSSDE